MKTEIENSAPTEKMQKPHIALKCPTSEELRLFVACRLCEEEVESIETHLSHCPNCSKLVSQLEKETSLDSTTNAIAPTDSSWSELQSVLAKHQEYRTGEHRVAPDPESLAYPKEIGSYELHEQLGQGGMGTVFKAVHKTLKREVAIKLIRQSKAVDPALSEHFVQEIEALGRLKHPNIVDATDAGVDLQGKFYLVMELLQGIDLHTLVHKYGPIPVAESCELIRQTALGLACIHEHGIIHRDIKPSNLFLTDQGVKILDLGLSLIRSNVEESQPQYVVGTPQFMSPEQKSSPKNLGPQSDLFSLGGTFYFLLHGKTPLQEDISKSKNIPLQNDVPKEILKIIQKLRAENPEKRMKSAKSVAEMLVPFSQNAQISSLLDENHAKNAENPTTKKDENQESRFFDWKFLLVLLATFFISFTLVRFQPWKIGSESETPPKKVQQLEKSETDMENPASSVAEEGWLTTKEVAEHLGVSENTVYRWISKNGLPAYKTGRLWRFKKSEVDQWIKNRPQNQQIVP